MNNPANLPNGSGGSDGSDGYTGNESVRSEDLFNPGWVTVFNAGGKGQHTTTKAFGESNGTLYAGGGGSEGAPGGSGGGGGFRVNGGANTGGGGGSFTGSGGSGIAIIRWGY